jgi:CPA1 family monovalent cation:H+ antiporter
MALSVDVLAVFLLISLASVLAARRARAPYTIVLVLVGLALAAVPISALSGLTAFFDDLASEQLFVGLVLPPLLFESIIGVKLADFNAVRRPALLMATAGVLISTLVVGVVLWKVLGLPFFVSFLFAALISPTDVATVLEVFRRANVPTRLATLVEMESVFNDPTGIAIFTVLLTGYATSALQPFAAVAEFAYTLTGGVLVGLGVSWLARRVQGMIDDPVTQVALTLTAVYGSYALATGLGTSGLMAVAVTGLYYGNFVLMTMKSRQIADATVQFWGVMAFVANAAAFFFIGVSTNIFLLAASFDAFLVAYAVVLMARITSVYPILSVSRVGGSAIPASWMNTATLGGVRGALAIVLVSTIPVATRQPVATLTFGVVMLSVLLQGPLLSRYTGQTFGRQETLQKYAAYESIYDMEGGRPPAQALSPDEEGRGEDELR